MTELEPTARHLKQCCLLLKSSLEQHGHPFAAHRLRHVTSAEVREMDTLGLIVKVLHRGCVWYGCLTKLGADVAIEAFAEKHEVNR